MARSPTIFINVPNASWAACRTGSKFSPRSFVQDSPIDVISAFVGVRGVVRRHRTRNLRLSVLTCGFLCLIPS